jgi:RNA polymerase sigma-70 factor (ECF subfamily)
MADLKNLSDNELLRLIANSNHAAFNEIYHRYFELLYTHAFQKLSNEEVAKDIIQEVFTALWFKRNSADNIKDLAAYLFSSTRYKIFDYFAHEKVQEKHLESLQAFLAQNPIVSTDYQIREAQFKAYIDQEIQKLPKKMRIVFLKSREEGLSYREIANELATSENNVSKQVNNALRVLRVKLRMLFFF